MAKSTSSSNLFSGFNPPKIDKRVEEKPQVKEQSVKTVETVQDPKVIDLLVKEEVRKIMESEKTPIQANKVGRPKKYMNSTKVISVRLDADTYEFVRKKGRVEYDGITDYINQLIQKEM